MPRGDRVKSETERLWSASAPEDHEKEDQKNLTGTRRVQSSVESTEGRALEPGRFWQGVVCRSEPGPIYLNIRIEDRRNVRQL